MIERLMPAIDGLLQKVPRAIIAIDGNSGAGKSTLAEALASVYGANVLHMDDFFLPPERKTPERLAQPGGNVDHERFKAEVLDPLRLGAAFTYRAFDCQTGGLKPPTLVEPRRLAIVEGSYSLHPALIDAYDFRIFCRIHPKAQEDRILRRNGQQMLQRFLEEWIPLENAYFEALGIPELCNLIIEAGA